MRLQHGTILLRDAAKADAKQLAAWWNDGAVMAHAGFPNGLGITEEEVIAGLGKGRLVIEEQNRLIGECSWRDKGRDIAEIGIKICETDCQNRGIGRIVLSMLIRCLFDNGFTKIILDTNLSNKRAQHVYESLGFRKLRIKTDSWTDQLGNLQSFVDYELTEDYFTDYARRESIFNYLNATYEPQAIIVYGSFADGSNNADSDFDCLVVSTKNGCRHDTTTVDGVVLDAFIYAPDEVSGEVDRCEFLQIYDGWIAKDTDGIAAALQHKIRAFLQDLPKKSPAEIQDSIAWCEKMLRRTHREDAEGYFRWHWLLHDSLEIYCDIRGQYYFGPKKSIRFMEATDPDGYRLYSGALANFEHCKLREWIHYLRKLADGGKVSADSVDRM